MNARDVEEWVGRYRRAWSTNDRQQIASLFAEDAVYFTEPFAEPWRGHEEIVERWLARRDEPGTTEFTSEVIAVDGSLGIVQGRTRYIDPPKEYANLWLIRLDPNGRAVEFTEWWMQK